MKTKINHIRRDLENRLDEATMRRVIRDDLLCRLWISEVVRWYGEGAPFFASKNSIKAHHIPTKNTAPKTKN